MLRQHGIVECSAELSDAIDNDIPLLKGSENEVQLRASALVACELLVIALNATQSKEDSPALGSNFVLTSAKLCNWLWGWLGKTPAGKAFPRHATPSTLFY